MKALEAGNLAEVRSPSVHRKRLHYFGAAILCLVTIPRVFGTVSGEDQECNEEKLVRMYPFKRALPPLTSIRGCS